MNGRSRCAGPSGTALVACILAAGVVASVAAQRGAGPDTGSPRGRALLDLTGQWVSVVTEDWRWRMVTPPIGDTASVPLNPEGRKVAAAWDPAADRRGGVLCRAFGPPGLIRQPGRIRISWENDDTLLLAFDAGTQTRRFHFGAPRAGAVRSLQGQSQARWFRQPQNRGLLSRGRPSPGGSMEVVTTNLRAGYLRPNGVPYSDRAVVREYFDSFTLPDGDGTWLIVTTVVEDPQFLTQEFVISSQFKRETDLSGWNPRPCDIPAPRDTARREAR